VVSAGHVRTESVVRIRNRAHDIGLGREMKHYFATVHCVFHGGPVPDIGFAKLDPRRKLARHGPVEIPVEIIEHQYVVRIRAGELLRQVPSDKAGAAGDQNLHRLQVYSRLTIPCIDSKQGTMSWMYSEARQVSAQPSEGVPRMERKKATDFPQELLNLFDRYVHGEIFNKYLRG
jgi:hypothetical protein